MSLFTKNDYNSNNGFQSSVWGPMVWASLHIISFNYPNKPTASDKKHYREFLLSYQYTLPCIYCRTNFNANMKRAGFSPKVFTNRNTFSRFIYKLHNCINEMLGKTVVITYDEVRSRYEHFRARCSEKETVENIIKQQKINKKELSCDSSLYGVKSKCVINIVPKKSKLKNFKMDKKCQTNPINKS
jgi:hypothetical protein